MSDVILPVKSALPANKEGYAYAHPGYIPVSIVSGVPPLQIMTFPSGAVISNLTNKFDDLAYYGNA